MAISSSVVAGILAGATAVSGIMNTLAQQRQAVAQARYQTQLATFEAAAQQIQGEHAELDYRAQAADLQRQQVRAAASQVVSGAGMGVSLSSGSLQSIINASNANYEADRQQLLRNGAIQRAASTYSSSGILASARLNEASVRSNRGWNTAAGLLGTASGVLNWGSKAGWFGN